MKFPTIPGFDEQAFLRYFKNTGLLLFGKVGSQAIKMASGILVANYLLSYNNGILTTSVSYVYLFAAIAGLGLDQFIVRELHQNPHKRDEILGTAFTLKVIAGLVCIPVIYAVWQLFPLSDVAYLLVFILSFTGLLQSFTVIEAYFQSEVKSTYIMQVQILGNIVSALVKGALILMKADLVYFAASFLIDVFLISAGYFLAYQRQGRSIFHWSFQGETARRLLHYSWPLIISGIMVSVYMKIDQIMLKELIPNGTMETGAYATAVNLSEALNFVPMAIVASLFPAILNARRDDANRYQRRLQNLYDLMVWISMAFAIFMTFAAPLVYKLFKPEFAAAAQALSIHVWGSIFVFLGVASGQYLIAEGYSKLAFLRTGVGAIVNILLNLILIPKMGMNGTAIATVIAYGVAAFMVLLPVKTRPQGIMMLKSLFLMTAFQKLFKLKQ